MKIKSLQLKNFKRFTDLTLQNIPDNTRLVLLIGANGSGKSSVFDAFETVSDFLLNSQFNFQSIKESSTTFFKDINYYQKHAGTINLSIETYQDGKITYDGSIIRSTDFLRKRMFYGRSAFRYVPRLTRTSIGNAIEIEGDADKPKYYIDTDQRFENDIDLLIKEVVEKVFQGINTDSSKQLDEIRAFLGQINDAFPRIFGTENGTMLSFKSFMPPADGKPSRLIFQKGVSELDYDLLSAGEKEVVNLLFNLFVRRRAYTNTVYFLDEIDTHLNTKLQYNLLKEIAENWIPAHCQLWTASHSLGFIDYANDSEEAVIFDFDDLDFDQPQALQPMPKNDNEVFEIAVGKTFIDKYVQGRKIIFSENTDTPYYNDLSFENVLFSTALDKTDAFHKAKNLKQFALIDRDYLGDDEIKEIKSTYPFLSILPFYSFENLLFHPDNLEEHYTNAQKPFDKKSYVQKLIQEKNTHKDYILLGISQARSGYPFFKENEHEKQRKAFKENLHPIVDFLRSDDINEFYKIFTMKDFATQLPERQNLSKAALAKTGWFKNQIDKAIRN